MPPAKRPSRTYDSVTVLNALTAQVEAIRTAVTRVTTGQLALPSGLPGWDVRRLVAHIASQIDAVPRLLSEPPPRATAPTVDLSGWAVSTVDVTDPVDTTTRWGAGEGGDPVTAIVRATERLEPVLEDAVREDWLLPHPRGAMRALDFTVTRLVELVVHSDDLARATGVAVHLDRYAVASVVRLLADALVVKAPGRAVELRVPPFVVVQCGAGPRHTRGVPPHVVETNPLTWMRLATGRITWREAVDAAEITASGGRADLSPQLPLVR